MENGNAKSIRIEQLKECVYQYFPHNVEWGTESYLNSGQHKQFLIKTKEFKHSGLETSFLNALKEMLPEYAVKDWTCFEEYNDIEIKILLHKGLSYLDDDTELLKAVGGKQRELMLFISPLGQYYFWRIQATTNTPYGLSFAEQFSAGEEDTTIVDKIEHFFDTKGYAKVTAEQAVVVLPDIATELKDLGTATIYDCLFNDLISPVQKVG